MKKEIIPPQRGGRLLFFKKEKIKKNYKSTLQLKLAKSS
jgi:hypothetical protein